MRVWFAWRNYMANAKSSLRTETFLSIGARDVALFRCSPRLIDIQMRFVPILSARECKHFQVWGARRQSHLELPRPGGSFVTAEPPREFLASAISKRA